MTTKSVNKLTAMWTSDWKCITQALLSIKQKLLSSQMTSNNMNLISEVFHGSVATTNTPDVVKMSHAMIHWQQHFSFLQSSPTSRTISHHSARGGKLSISFVSLQQLQVKTSSCAPLQGAAISLI